MWSHGQAVKTRPSQGLITSSILVGITIFMFSIKEDTNEYINRFLWTGL